MDTIRDSIVTIPNKQGRASFLGFEIFITPLLIKVGFLVGVLASFIVGGLAVREAWTGFDPVAPLSMANLMLLARPVGCFIVFPIALRVTCEFYIILFKIYDKLANGR